MSIGPAHGREGRHGYSAESQAGYQPAARGVVEPGDDEENQAGASEQAEHRAEVGSSPDRPDDREHHDGKQEEPDTEAGQQAEGEGGSCSGPRSEPVPTIAAS